MKKIYLTILTVLLAIALIQTVAAQTVTGTSTVTASNIMVYSDEAATQQLTTINWGILAPGENKTVTTYIVSTANYSISIVYTSNNTDVSLVTPEIGVILANTVYPANFTVLINENAIEGAFTLDITLTGTEITEPSPTPPIPEIPEWAVTATVAAMIASAIGLTVIKTRKGKQ